jgi:hypothetical protein
MNQRASIIKNIFFFNYLAINCYWFFPLFSVGIGHFVSLCFYQQSGIRAGQWYLMLSKNLKLWNSMLKGIQKNL